MIPARKEAGMSMLTGPYLSAKLWPRDGVSDQLRSVGRLTDRTHKPGTSRPMMDVALAMEMR